MQGVELIYAKINKSLRGEFAENLHFKNRK